MLTFTIFSGLQYKVVKEGDGVTPAEGDKVTLDWEGYTIGYYGRPFQTRNKVKVYVYINVCKSYIYPPNLIYPALPYLLSTNTLTLPNLSTTEGRQQHGIVR